MERDEVYVPKTRSDLGIPEEQGGHKIDYDEYFGDTPIYTLYMLVRQQLLAFPAYLSKHRRSLEDQNMMLTATNSLQCIRSEELSEVDEPFRSYVIPYRALLLGPPAANLLPDSQRYSVHEGAATSRRDV